MLGGGRARVFVAQIAVVVVFDECLGIEIVDGCPDSVSRRRTGNTCEAESLDTPIHSRRGGACRHMSGLARSLPIWGVAIGDPVDLCAPLRWPEG